MSFALTATTVRGPRWHRLLRATGSSEYAIFQASSVPPPSRLPPTLLCCPHAGVLCGSCNAGYGSIDVGTCIKCPNRSLNSLYFSLATIMTLGTLALTIRCVHRAVGSKAAGGREGARALAERSAAPHFFTHRERLSALSVTTA